MTSRRVFLASLASLGALPSILARADRGPARPRLFVRGIDSSVTTEGAPHHAMFELRNATGRVTEVRLPRLVVTDAGMRIPVPIRAVHNAGGSELRLPLQLVARASKRITVHFDLPDRLRGGSEWRLELHATSSIGAARGVATVRRAHRHRIVRD